MTTTAQRSRMVKKLERLAARHREVTRSLAKLEDQRLAAYAEARRLDPPITIKAIADTFGVTEAAVTARLRRAGLR